MDILKNNFYELSNSSKRRSQKKCKLTFSSHEIFPFRYTWLKKIVDAVSDGHSIFNKDTPLSDIGVGKNMFYSMGPWGKTNQDD